MINQFASLSKFLLFSLKIELFELEVHFLNLLWIMH